VSRADAALRLVGRSVRVDVPATSANLGAGFDTLALALDLAVDVHVLAVDPRHGRDARIEVTGEGAGHLPKGRRNRFLTALLEGLRVGGLDGDALGWDVRMANAIPVSRGLGSSASATVAALVAADALLDGALGERRILELSARAEGHADNAAAALLGGFCVVSPHADDGPTAVRFDPPPSLLAVLYIPERHLSTAAMRDALPGSVPFGDAVHNVGAAALTVAALAQGRLDLLRMGTADRLHEPYRASAYPELPELVSAARAAGALGACLSGAGSTIIAFCDDPGAGAAVAAAMERRAQQLRLPGRAAVHRARAAGATITEDNRVEARGRA
jgi:homoserine kinase